MVNNEIFLVNSKYPFQNNLDHWNFEIRGRRGSKNPLKSFMDDPLLSLRFRLLFCALLELISFAEAYLKRSCEKNQQRAHSSENPQFCIQLLNNNVSSVVEFQRWWVLQGIS